MFLNSDSQTIIVDSSSINPPVSPKKKRGENGRRWKKMGITKSDRYLRMINYYLVRSKKKRRETDLEKYYTLKFLLDDEPKSIFELIELVADATNRDLDPNDKTTYMRFYQFVKRLVREGLVEEKKEGLEILFTAHHKVKEDLQKAYGSDKLFIMTVKDKDELKELIKEEIMSEVKRMNKEITNSLLELNRRVEKQLKEIERRLNEIKAFDQKLSTENKELRREINQLESSIEELSTEIYNLKVLHSGVLTEIATFLTQQIKMTNLKMDLEASPFTRRLLTNKDTKDEKPKNRAKKRLIYVEKKKREDDFDIDFP